MACYMENGRQNNIESPPDMALMFFSRIITISDNGTTRLVISLEVRIVLRIIESGGPPKRASKKHPNCFSHVKTGRLINRIMAVIYIAC